MSEREEFLKWYQDTWFSSDEKIQQWKNTSVADIAEYAWQHQKKRIDDLEGTERKLLKRIHEIALDWQVAQAKLDIATEALERLQQLGNEPYIGNSTGNTLATEALNKIRKSK